MSDWTPPHVPPPAPRGTYKVPEPKLREPWVIRCRTGCGETVYRLHNEAEWDCQECQRKRNTPALYVVK